VGHDNKRIMARWFRAVMDDDIEEAARALWHPDFVYHMDTSLSGIDGMICWAKANRTAFPDMELTIRHQIAEGDWVATLFDMKATHRAEFLGVPASGNRVEVTVVSYARYADGKVIEEWEIFDSGDVIAQMQGDTS
jgi:steroid delta-isomerase-like uncharacterized protein